MIVHNNFKGGMLGPLGQYTEIGDKPIYVKRAKNVKVTPNRALELREFVKAPPLEGNSQDGNIFESPDPGIRVLPFKVGDRWYALHYTPWHYLYFDHVRAPNGTPLPPRAERYHVLPDGSSRSASEGPGHRIFSSEVAGVENRISVSRSNLLTNLLINAQNPTNNLFSPYMPVGLSNFNVFTIYGFPYGGRDANYVSKIVTSRLHSPRTTDIPKRWRLKGGGDSRPYRFAGRKGNPTTNPGRIDIPTADVYYEHLKQYKPLDSSGFNPDQDIYDGGEVHSDDYNVEYAFESFREGVIIYDRLGTVEPVYFTGRGLEYFSATTPSILHAAEPITFPARLKGEDKTGFEEDIYSTADLTPSNDFISSPYTQDTGTQQPDRRPLEKWGPRSSELFTAIFAERRFSDRVASQRIGLNYTYKFNSMRGTSTLQK